MSILIDRDTRVLVQGITGRDGSFHAKQMMEYGTKVVAGVTPGKGGHEGRRRPGVRHRSRGGRGDGPNASVIYVPAPFAPDAIYEAATPASRWSSASPRGSRCATWSRSAICEGRSTRADRAPNCPGLISPGQCKVGIMPGFIHAGTRGRGEPQRHAHLRGRRPAHAREDGPVDLHRHRRRSDHRHELHRRARAVRGRRRDRRGRADRRDRRHRRGGRGGLIEEHDDEAGGGVHRRADRAPGKRMGHAAKRRIISGGGGSGPRRPGADADVPRRDRAAGERERARLVLGVEAASPSAR